MTELIPSPCEKCERVEALAGLDPSPPAADVE